MVKTLNLLLIEDSPETRLLTERALQGPGAKGKGGPGFSVTCAETLAEAETFVREKKFDMILVDLNLPDSSGFDTFDSIQKQVKDTPLVIFTTSRRDHTALLCLEHGASQFIVKGPGIFKNLVQILTEINDNFNLPAGVQRELNPVMTGNKEASHE